ncbi:YciI family protein [Massilia sp. BJB1822]|uniref:YciI family protein n=1 Tax=Massilia sp. BJB1822 TaxID=2744470 RepID=UPI0015931FE7|nr:YciI family protein [Massilia sp. BJB1822]NVD97295.1 hypothetical protein [Massilia sp. BJB1822]
MRIVLLKFAEHKDQAPQYMEAHNAWLKQGFDDGVFVLAGSLQPRRGGAIIAHGCSLDELQARIAEDPFVAFKVVEAEILEISPSKADERLAFLLA